MSQEVFGAAYAAEYDLLYGDKDYQGECDSLEQILHGYGDCEVKTILDLGCGTGGHAIPLARRGYCVTGVDRSAAMLDRARQKLEAKDRLFHGRPPEFLEGDIRDLDLGRSFDAVLMMFAVLGYQLTNQQVSCALRTVRRHLRPGGLFVCDVWYGPAVLRIGPSDRVKVVTTDEIQLIRTATASIDLRHHICQVRYRLWQLRGDRLINTTEEVHAMRFFFPMELEHFLSQNDMELSGIHPFPSLDGEADETTWNVLVCAERHDSATPRAPTRVI